jgi:hypothetical protein
MVSSIGKDSRLRRIAMLDILPVKPHQGWSDLQLDEALHRSELFHGNLELYAAVRKEAIRRGLGDEEDYPASPFVLTDTGDRKLPFLLRDEGHIEKHERKERKQRLKKLLMEMESEKKEATALNRLLRLAAMDSMCNLTATLDRQLDLYLRRSIERTAHMVPSKNTNTPPMWKHNMDYASEEGSPYFGNVGEFLKRFPGGISEWRKWRKSTRKQRERKHRIASLMPAQADDGLEEFLKAAWEQERHDMATVAHFVPDGGDDVAKLGDKEPKLWSDEPKWKSVDEFLKAHRKHYGQDADDAALKAARDFVRYWRLTTKKPKVSKSK